MFTRSIYLSITGVLVAVCVLAFAQGVRAQEPSTPHNMTGCLRAGPANTYMLSDHKGAPRKAVIVSSSADVDLANQLGHKVEITGTLVPAKQAEANPDVPKAFVYMNVTAIKTLAATCP